MQTCNCPSTNNQIVRADWEPDSWPTHVDPETLLLLLFFDIEELAELTPEQLQLLKTAATEDLAILPQNINTHDIEEEYLDRIRTTLTCAKAQEDSPIKEQADDLLDKMSRY